MEVCRFREMGKTALAPVYISIAWVLIISYQMLTQTAVETVIAAIGMLWPSGVSMWLTSRMQTIVFIHAFAWIFLLSSVIPSKVLGEERSVLALFFFCLTLSIVPIWIKDTLPLVTENPIANQVLSLAGLFEFPLFAALFLALPYLLMLWIDLRARRESRRIKEMAQRLETTFASHKATNHN
jgi:hypothetical protein